MNDNLPDIKEYKKYNYKLTPFKLCVLENFPFIEADFDAITNYQLLCKVVEYLNHVIDNQNTVEDNFKIMDDNLNTLYNFLDTLDLQDEVNNKLDEMAQDGTLLNILSNYANIERLYNTFEDLYNDENVTKNQKVKVFGMTEINDGNGGEFIITENEGIPLNNGLYAKPLDNYQENFYNEITYTRERHYDTDCYVTTIPLNDNDNNQINLYVAKKQYTDQSPLKYAQDNLTTLTINASLNIKNTEDESKSGEPIIIGNGVILNNNSMYGESGVADNFLYVGITENRNILEFKVNNTTAEQLLQAGCINVFDCYYKLIENYFPLDLSNVVTNEEGIVTGYHPRQVLCEMEDKSILIFTCDGRTMQSRGLTSEQLQNILVEKRVRNAWNLDGGGSTSTEIKTVKINRYFDSGFTKDRLIPYTLNIKKTTKNKNIANVYSFLSNMLDLYNYKYQQERIRMHNLRSGDANDLIGELYFGFGTQMVNTPVKMGYFINLSDTITSENRWLYNKQIFISSQGFDNKRIWTRVMINGEWSEWFDIFPSVYRVTTPNNRYVLQTNDAYEELPLNNAYELQPLSKAIKINDDNSFSFSDLGSRLLYFQCRIEGQEGNKFVKVVDLKGDILYQSNYHSGTGRTQLTLICPILINDATNDKWKIYVYGKQNDIIDNIYIYIK